MTLRAIAWTLAAFGGGAVVVALLGSPPVSVAAPAPAETPLQPAVGASQPNASTPARQAEPAGSAQRTAVPVDVEAGGEQAFQLTLHVTDGDDQPLPGAAVYLAPRELGLNLVGWTDGHGRLELRWRARRESMVVLYAAEHPAHGSSNLRRIELTATPAAVALQLRSTPEAHPIPPEEAGERFAARLLLSHPQPMPLPPPSLRWRHVRRTRALLDDQGWLQFSAPGVELPGERVDPPRDRRYPEEPLDERHVLAPGDEAAFVRGRIHDDRGRPVAGARVRASDAARRVTFSTRSQADGAFGLGPVPARGLHVSFGGGDLGRSETDLGVAGARVHVLQPALQRGRELAGRLLDREGVPLGQWKVELAALDPRQPWADSTWTDAEGRFRVPNVPNQALRLDATRGEFPDAARGDFNGSIPVCRLGGVDLAREQDYALDCSARAAGALALRLLGHDGLPLEDAEVRLLPERGDRGTLIEFDPRERNYHITGLAAGRYELAIHRPGEHALHWPGSLALDGERELDLGPLSFEPLAVLCVEPARGAGLVEYRLERAEGPASRALLAHVGTFRMRGRWRAELPAGEYRLSVLGTGRAQLEELTLFAGRTRTLALRAR